MASETLTAGADSIEGSGFPLAFKTRQGKGRPAVLGAGTARDVFTAEARQLALFQKEAVVSEGATGSAWRMATDEGKHLGGTDLAPFPLGFYNAGLHADIYNRLATIAKARDIQIDDVNITLYNHYWMTGSFVRGDGHGYGEPATVTVRVKSPAASDEIARLVADAIKASPAMATMKTAFTNTFAIYVNGRRRVVTSMANSDAPDAPDPYKTYSRPPAPLSGANDLDDLIWKTGKTMEGEITAAPTGTDDKTKKIIRTISGESRLLQPGITETATVLGLPGMTEFALKSDERPDGDQGPSGLALITAGIAFCYMTQLGRYIEHQKFNIRGVRLVQHTPFTLTGDPADGSWTGGSEPTDTHLFLSGDESDETHERLMTIAANTCYLHATLSAALEPVVSVEHNGKTLS